MIVSASNTSGHAAAAQAHLYLTCMRAVFKHLHEQRVTRKDLEECLATIPFTPGMAVSRQPRWLLAWVPPSLHGYLHHTGCWMARRACIPTLHADTPTSVPHTLARLISTLMVESNQLMPIS
jgi:hypothetical protein